MNNGKAKKKKGLTLAKDYSRLAYDIYTNNYDRCEESTIRLLELVTAGIIFKVSDIIENHNNFTFPGVRKDTVIKSIQDAFRVYKPRAKK